MTRTRLAIINSTSLQSWRGAQSHAWLLAAGAGLPPNPEALFSCLKCPESWTWLDNASETGDSNWSYFASAPSRQAVLYRDHVLLSGVSVPLGGLEALRELLGTPAQDRHRTGPEFRGGWAGWLGYGLTNFVRTSEIPSNAAQPLGALSFFDRLLAFEHSEKRWWGVALAESQDAARSKIDRLVAQIASWQIANVASDSLASCDARTITSNFDQQEFEERVHRILQYIAAGDIYQANLAQRFAANWPHDERLLYSRLRQESPAQFGAFLPSALTGCDTGVFSISPELFLRVRGREILTRPIKGTRPCQSSAERITASRQLSSSSKERAELNMIVDLERNDLGRVCEYGSVRVVNAGEVQTLPTLIHRVAEVRGTLRAGVGPCDILDAMFPGGSITGAPKIRAMQIISELESVPRGPYCGAIGWFGCNGDMELSIAIRTAVLRPSERRVYYHAGAGIVADSEPAREYEETLHKARAFFRAINAGEPRLSSSAPDTHPNEALA